MDAIAVKGLDFSYGNTQILKNINFTVPEGRLMPRQPLTVRVS